MKRTLAPKERVTRAVRRLIRAEEAYSWRGAGDPDDIEGIEAKRKKAWVFYYKLINEVLKDEIQD